MRYSAKDFRDKVDDLTIAKEIIDGMPETCRIKTTFQTFYNEALGGEKVTQEILFDRLAGWLAEQANSTTY